ncbi:MAG: aquaporin [Candidatus Micrarchaeota archaeon]|nr:aquaporin [Candidatus Micrarchaeota archaeon]
MCEYIKIIRNEKKMKELIAEFIGTFTLVLVGAGAVVLNAGLVGIALAHGLVVFTMATAFGNVSGGHFNPAVSIAISAIGKLSKAKLAKYVTAQLLGAAVAGLVLLYLFGNTTANLGTPALANGVDLAKGIFLELLITFFLVIVVLNTAVVKEHSLAPLAIGMTLALDILFAGPLTGAAANPARAFGPALASGYWLNQFVYWIGPIIGALLAALATKVIHDEKLATLA